jgi:hypothetical protein
VHYDEKRDQYWLVGGDKMKNRNISSGENNGQMVGGTQPDIMAEADCVK